MDHQGYWDEGGHDCRVEEGQRRMQQEMRCDLMEEPTQRGFDGEKEVCCARYWPRVAAGDGGGYAIGCLMASTPEEGRQEGGKDLNQGKGALEGEGTTAPV